MQYRLMKGVALLYEAGDMESFIVFEKQAFRYFEEARHIELILSYGPLVVQVYEDLNQYKRAAALYKLLFETSEQMRLTNSEEGDV